MRSIWNGAITFGMVTIPVKLYAATEQRDVSFHEVLGPGVRPGRAAPVADLMSALRASVEAARQGRPSSGAGEPEEERGRDRRRRRGGARRSA